MRPSLIRLISRAYIRSDRASTRPTNTPPHRRVCSGLDDARRQAADRVRAASCSQAKSLTRFSRCANGADAHVGLSVSGSAPFRKAKTECECAAREFLATTLQDLEQLWRDLWGAMATLPKTLFLFLCESEFEDKERWLVRAFAYGRCIIALVVRDRAIRSPDTILPSAFPHMPKLLCLCFMAVHMAWRRPLEGSSAVQLLHGVRHNTLVMLVAHVEGTRPPDHASGCDLHLWHHYERHCW